MPGFCSLKSIRSDMGPGQRLTLKPLSVMLLKSRLNTTVNAVSMFLLNFQADKEDELFSQMFSIISIIITY